MSEPRRHSGRGCRMEEIFKIISSVDHLRQQQRQE